MEPMIVRLQTAEEVRQIRRKFYADPIFLLTSQLVMNRCLSLKPEELYATADLWVASLVENGVCEPEFMAFELDDLRAELLRMQVDRQDGLLLQAIALFKLIALMKAGKINGQMPTALAQVMDNDPVIRDFLRDCVLKEAEMKQQNRKVELLSYDLVMATKQHPSDRESIHQLFKQIVEEAGRSTNDTIEKHLMTLQEINRQYRGEFDDEINWLLAKREERLNPPQPQMHVSGDFVQEKHVDHYGTHIDRFDNQHGHFMDASQSTFDPRVALEGWTDGRRPALKEDPRSLSSK